MILDYTYNRNKRNLSISYVTENGGKQLLNFNVDRFKTYYSTPNGSFENWDGAKCDVKWVDKPSLFEYKTYFEEMLNSTYKKLISGKSAPKLYTFDIETEISDEFPEPSEAKFPITTISIANYKCDVVVLGTRKLDEIGEKYIQDSFKQYMSESKYFMSLGLELPKIKYVYFESEEDMLRYFLQNIVAKVPILAGWNSLLFDWQYIQNRIKNYYPSVSLSLSSMNRSMTYKNYTDMRGNKVRLNIPNHTLVLDMMDVVGEFDMVVMPIKESLSLDYISSNSIGMHKIKYNGDLQDLFDNDYPKYVFYNAVDSILVQLIDRRFKTLSNIYTQALYVKDKIGNCFSKIAISESLVFNDFYEHGIKIVNNYEQPDTRGNLVGAYVKQPMPGKHKFVCCNDFASLYPTGIITCNISYDNYLGNDYTEEEIECFKKDPNYFVSINGNVYKNDKDYSFKRIQKKLKENRNVGKYLAKQLDAEVMVDVDHILKGFKQLVKKRKYSDNLIVAIKELGYDIQCSDDLMGNEYTLENFAKLTKFKKDLRLEIEYQTSFEQAMKLLGNSMYGGSSHIAFFWFNIGLANDITGEGRNLIHLMEKHIPEYWRDNWENLTSVHKMLGVEVDINKAEKIKNEKGTFVEMVYGDTDSLYISYEPLLNSIKGVENMSLEQKRDIIVKLNTDFMDGHNGEYMDKYYTSRHAISAHKFELETLSLSGVWLNVKKRYAQILLWKDGKIFDTDSLPLKVKGLEMIKSSFPLQAREGLKHIVRFLLEYEGEEMLLQQLNMLMQKEKEEFYNAPLENICGSVGVNGYTKYIINDQDPNELVTAPKCPYNVRALGNYNRIRNIYNLPGDPMYGGKMRWYYYFPEGNRPKTKTLKKLFDKADVFAFRASEYPEWANKYAPVAKDLMFQKMMLDPFNRIIAPMGIGELLIDGSIQLTNLFGF